MDTNSGIYGGLVGLHDEALLTEKALAGVLGVVDRTARRMVQRGELPPPISLGHRRIWKVATVRKWLDRLADDALRRESRLQAEREKAEARLATL